MNRLLVITIAATAAFAASVSAAPQLQRVRGIIGSVENSSITVRSVEGSNSKVTLEPDTKFVSVVKSDLTELSQGNFIGTATKGPPGAMVALEVVIFPESMRGTGEGHYPWDRLADTTTTRHPRVTSSMTNGNVDTVESSGSAPKVGSSMTNGNVEASRNGAGGREITVSYAGGKQQIAVPATAPIVAFQPADRSILTAGAKIFVVAANEGGKLTAKLVGVGKDGLTPPM